MGSPDLRLGESTPVLFGLGQHRRDLARAPIGVEPDEDQIRGGDALRDPDLVPRLGDNPNTHLQRRPAGPVDPSLRVYQIPDVHWLEERHLVHGGGHRRPTGCRCATAPATSSTSFMITPPCTVPSRFVSSAVMIRDNVVWAADVGRPGKLSIPRTVR